MNGKKEFRHRVVTFLTREELEFMDKLNKDAMFSTGKHISRAQILQDLAELLSRTDMDAKSLKNDADLEQRMMEAIARMSEQFSDKKEQGQ